MWLSNQGKYMSVQLPWADLDPRTEISPSMGWNRHSALLAAVSSGSAVRASKLDLVEGRKFDSHLELIIFLRAFWYQGSPSSKLYCTVLVSYAVGRPISSKSPIQSSMTGVVTVKFEPCSS